MKPRIAIPLPHGGDPEYALRAIPQYERALELSGGEPIRIPLDRTPEEIMKLIEGCDGVLFPGSKADVDPAKFDAPRHPKTEAADPKRDTVDELLLQDAYNMRKPILCICYGLQILNVYQSVISFSTSSPRLITRREGKSPWRTKLRLNRDRGWRRLLHEQPRGDSRPRLSSPAKPSGQAREGTASAVLN